MSRYALINSGDSVCPRKILPATETGVFTETQLKEEREQYILEDGDDLRFQQEYMCSFEGAVQGSYYGKMLQLVEQKKQITTVPYDVNLPVTTVWDLGMSDATSIWFLQTVNKEVRLIDYLEAEGEGLAYYYQELQAKGYTYKRHYAPHDIKVRELGSGQSRLETAKSLGIQFEVVPNISVQDGIQAVRKILPLCWFDKDKCEHGLSALYNYHKFYDEKRKIYKNTPDHDWSSHGADSFRYLAVVYNKLTQTAHNPFSNNKPTLFR